MPVIKGQILEGSTIHTDDGKLMMALIEVYDHHDLDNVLKPKLRTIIHNDSVHDAGLQDSGNSENSDPEEMDNNNPDMGPKNPHVANNQNANPAEQDNFSHEKEIAETIAQGVQNTTFIDNPQTMETHGPFSQLTVTIKRLAIGAVTVTGIAAVSMLIKHLYKKYWVR